MNHAELHKAIIDWSEVRDEEIFESQISTIIRAAERNITHMIKVPAYSKSQNLMLSSTGDAADDRFLNLPVDFLSMEAMSLVINDTVSGLERMSPDVLHELYSNWGRRSKPKYWAWFRGLVAELAPTPDVDYTVNVRYFARPASIVDSDTSWIGDNAEDLLLHGCLFQAATILKHDEMLKREQIAYTTAMQAYIAYSKGRVPKDDFNKLDMQIEV